MNDLKKLHIFACITVAAFFISLLFFPFYFKYFSDLIAAGRSDAKEIILPIFLIIITYLFYFKKTNPIKKSEYSVLSKKIVSVVSILFFAQLMSFFLLCVIFGMGVFPTNITVRDGLFSYNAINHIHSFKPVFGWVSEFVPQLTNYVEPGYAIMGVIPFYVFIPFTFLFLYLFYLLFKWIPLHAQKNKSFVFFFIFSIALFSLLKNIIDGGIFNAEAIITIIVLFFLFFNEKISLFYKSAISAIVLLFVVLIIFIFRPDAFMPYFTAIVFGFAFYVATYYSFKKIKSSTPIWAFILHAAIYIIIISIITLISINISGSTANFSLELEHNNTTTISSNTSIFLVVPTNLDLSKNEYFRVLKKDPIHSLSIIYGVTLKDVTLTNILSSVNERQSVWRVGVDGVLCSSAIPFDRNFKLFGFKGSLQKINSESISVEQNNENSYFALFKGCLPNYSDILIDYMSSRKGTYAMTITKFSAQ